MRFPGLVLVVTAMVLGVTGCKQTEKIVKVNADGTGTIEETIMRDKELIEWSAKMAVQSNGAQPAFFDEARFKAAATKIGEEVTFVSAKQLKTERGDGFTVVYAFADINKVKLDPSTDDLSEAAAGNPAKGSEGLITFRFAKGGPAELHILMPSPDLKEKTSSIDFKNLDGQMMEAFREGLKSMRLTLAVEVAGTVRQTNAEYHEGSRVTLDAMDFGKITADKQRFEALLKAGDVSKRTEKAMLTGVEGAKIEVNPDVSIQFQ